MVAWSQVFQPQGVAYHNKGAGHHQQCGDDGVQHPRHGKWQCYEIIRKGPDKILADDGKTSRGACVAALNRRHHHSQLSV